MTVKFNFSLIFTLFCSQLLNLHGLRHLESIKKHTSPSKSVNIVHYVIRNGDNTFKIEDIGVKNLKIEYNREWLSKGTWDDSYNTTG